MRRVIVFLPGEKVPRFAWMKEKKHMSYSEVDYSSYCPAFAYQTPINTNAWTGKGTGYTINLGYDDSFLKNYSDPNKAVITATQGHSQVLWRGPLFAYCGLVYNRGECKGEIRAVDDVDMRTYADLVAYLIDYCNKTPEHKLRKGPRSTASESLAKEIVNSTAAQYVRKSRYRLLTRALERSNRRRDCPRSRRYVVHPPEIVTLLTIQLSVSKCRW